MPQRKYCLLELNAPYGCAAADFFPTRGQRWIEPLYSYSIEVDPTPWLHSATGWKAMRYPCTKSWNAIGFQTEAAAYGCVKEKVLAM